MPDSTVGHGGGWQAFECPHCGRVTSYPLPPAGPGRPSCTYGHRAIVMTPAHVVAFTRDETREFLAAHFPNLRPELTP